MSDKPKTSVELSKKTKIWVGVVVATVVIGTMLTSKKEEKPSVAEDETTPPVATVSEEQDTLAIRTEEALKRSLMVDSFTQTCTTEIGAMSYCFITGVESPTSGNIVIKVQDYDKDLGETIAQNVMAMTKCAVPDLSYIQAVDPTGKVIGKMRRSESRLQCSE